ncbi:MULTISPECIES: DUF4292 domain-containing protein [Pedobacter]|uniref:DUF4292 domain-containing protein n=1 Tax=Pedobacter TaxID=84567 RepID=UPI0021092A28|nr:MULTISPECIES: DUF4292 domain-containing protein [unclassified Pedobacter]
MKRNQLNSLLLLLVVVLAAGCKTKKAVVTVPRADTVVAAPDGRAETLRLLQSKDADFNTLSLKARASMDINGNSSNVNMTIRMEKDKRIWVSLTAFAGIEVARALITPDSIKVRNNLQSVYLKKPFNYIHRFTGKSVDFQLLQSILLGNTITGFMTNEASLNQENGVWVLKGQREDLVYRSGFNTLFKVAAQHLNELKSGQGLKVTYGEYQEIGQTLFPTALKINSMAGKQTIGVQLEYSKIEGNVPLEFPFNVPGKFEVIN